MSYLQQLEALPTAKRWPQVRQWMREEPAPLFAELHRYRPILQLPEVTIASRFDDCVTVLRRHETFGVDLYKPKQGDYWMAQDDTAIHWREKSVMRAILDREDIPTIREYVGAQAATILGQAVGSIDAVGGLSRAVPIALVQDWFGFADSDPDELCDWSYWNQMDAFHNQPFDSIVVEDPALIVRNRKAANDKMRQYLIGLVKRRIGELKSVDPDVPNDPVVRLLKLSFSGALKLDVSRVILNVGGLLIGAVETTSHAAINALSVIMDRPEVFAQARRAAMGCDTAVFDGYVFEALRIKPAFPYFFRTCHAPTVLAPGTDYATTIEPGTTVLALTHAAMHDADMFPEPDTFDATRPTSNMFHFGLGLHECLGRAIGGVMIPEIVRQCLRLPDLEAAGPVDYKGGPVPEAFPLRWSVMC